MAIDLKELQRDLAKYKVYDAWQYVDSLDETLSYMSVSCELLMKVYDHKLKTFSKIENELIETARKTGKVSLSQDVLNETNLSIAGFEINNSMFLSKIILEFFHYARISLDILFQIINAALFGDQSIDINARNFPCKIIKLLNEKQVFPDLKKLLVNNKDNNNYNYLHAFDNYNKHIKTILISVNKSFLFGDKNEFLINEFTYDGSLYSSENAIDKVIMIKDYVIHTIQCILFEIQKQIPNCLDNSKRIQKLSYKVVGKELEKGVSIDHVSFFIDVENCINELPSEIKVYPLIIKPNDEIYCFDFKFDTIFIKKRDCGEESILGCAKLKNSLSTNEFYRVFDIIPCDVLKYHEYLIGFKKNYSNVHLDFCAMEGEMIFIKA